MLFVGHINFGKGFDGRPSLTDISNHSHNSHGALKIKAVRKSMTDGILTRKGSAGQFLVDDDCIRSIESVALVEIASGLQRNT